MEIVKKNIFAIVCGVIALLAIVSIFFPMGGMFDDLRTRVGQSSEMHDTIVGLMGKQRTAPSINFLNPDEKPPLEMFPTRAVIAEGEKVVAEVKGQAEKMLKQALEMNRREPLTKRSLPAGRGADLSEFKRLYYVQMDNLVEKMNATVPPTPTEVENEAQRLWDNVWAKNVQVDAQGRGVNEQEVRAAFEADKVNLAARMKKEKATKATMYIAGVMNLNPQIDVGRGVGMELPPSLDYHTGIPAPRANVFPDIVDVWIAQLGLWIQDDIVQAIINTNATAGSKRADGQVAMPTVADAPIKQLVRIVIPKDYILPKGPPHQPIEQAKAADANRDQAAQSTDTAEAPADTSILKAVTASPTARASNAIYDVMHFHVTVDIEADMIPVFIDSLTRNRFTTVLSTNIRAVDLDRAFQAGYVYGNKPVVRLDLKGETIFFRDWTRALMPAGVKRLMNVQEPPATATASN